MSYQEYQGLGFQHPSRMQSPLSETHSMTPTSDISISNRAQAWSDPMYDQTWGTAGYGGNGAAYGLAQPPMGRYEASGLCSESSNGSGTVGESQAPPMGVLAQYAQVSHPMTLQSGQMNNPRDFTSAPSRTVYLGNVPPYITTKELLDHVRSGVVEEVKILPEKMCAFISFVEENSALLFHSDAILKRLNIDDRDIKIGWGKPTQIDPIVAAGITNDGATRNVYIGKLNTNKDICAQWGVDPNEEVITEEKLRNDLSDFGEVENVKIVPEKGIAFVHFSSIFAAIKVVANLANINPYYAQKKIFYGKDRCAFITKTQQHNAAQFLGIQPGMESFFSNDRELISQTLLQQSAAAAAIATSAGGANNLGNRTIYLGNLPKDVKLEEICNSVRGGLLQHIKLLSDRHVCFVTFIDPTAAAQFYAMSSLHGLTIHNKRCKIGWGKHSGPLPNPLALAVSRGASRNIYLGNIDFAADKKSQHPIFTEAALRAVFQEFGEVEQINFLYERNCCFINFANISSAILAIDKIKSIPTFKDLKINFGKDRCGNVPRQFC
ncbi:AFL061Cp [Eremothecium gossypii ATCC 10895]|uniref:AFL061Cp n=1 Tax=Eremothecium gossypii (strain ATCC 10895 / CBS 109.51 / FGSC 9923 / NRRL Y-1056) TaxID=284811 RepID=Q754X7_EREGS|nr:AFL061Cp [Eremothecium gossypii ATCC 10895]AAS53311.2 AFL061Cp [Eremothecium gossypii ATCC 10895]AEY97622.1 FAFL061Cp [Eremothecium gossypii FDAG1]